MLVVAQTARYSRMTAVARPPRAEINYLTRPLLATFWTQRSALEQSR